MNQEKIGKFISQKRKEVNLTQEDLAEKLNISKNAVSKWERGLNLPNVSIMQELCEILNITIIELLNGEETTKEEGYLEYIKYHDKKQKQKITIIFIILITLFILGFLFLFYLSNYNKVKGYNLSGNGQNFDYTEGFLLTSNIKYIYSFGRINIKNDQIKPIDIKNMELKVNDQIIVSGNNLQSKTIIEDFGYNEIFTKETINNLDKWTLTITYQLNNKTQTETINLQNELIIQNNKLYYQKENPITLDNQTKKTTTTKSHDKTINHLIKKGYTQSDSITFHKTFKDKSKMYVTLTKNGNRYHYKKPNFIFYGRLNSRFLSISELDDEGYLLNFYAYDMKNNILYGRKDKVITNETIESKAQEFITLYQEEFTGIYSYLQNEQLGDEEN